ncbi:hypothetical protein ACFOYU_03330 [Microvirga sp. GCM10011540]|uniref:hypothetical protein n=1 Tax=Microvirga sp. GCM10011540 TaxID=3317338 RepID=UPI00362310B7
MARISRSAIAFAFFWGSGVSVTDAHDWYPITCCSEKDCRALIEANGETVLESIAGWELWDGRVVPRDAAKPSPDGKFHLCENPAKQILCFFAPPGAS